MRQIGDTSIAPLADANRRAYAMRTARTDAMRRALAHRICFDLLAALRSPATTTRSTNPTRTR